MTKSKKGSVKIQRSFVLGYLALGMVVMAAGVVMGTSNRVINADTASTVVISSPRALSASDMSLENKDIVVANLLTVAGSHTFNSLTIKSSGVVTHDYLTAADVQSDGVSLTASGADKKVDLTIRGDTVIEWGGGINVDGRGFTATDPTKIVANAAAGTNGKGNGFGGGYNFGTYDEITVAAGGGHGGKGANSMSGSNIKSEAPGGAKYDDPANPVLPGSAGGSAKRWRHGNSDISTGGAGGGAIHLKTRTLTVPSIGAISANGASGLPCRAEMVCAGGGAGGSIFIEITNKTLQTALYQDKAIALSVNYSAGAAPSYNTAVASNKAEPGTLAVGLDVVTSGNSIQVKGGSGYPTNDTRVYGAPGAGGRIAIAYSPVQGCPEVDLNNVTADKWTQNYCEVNPSDTSKFSNTIATNLKSDAGNTVAAYNMNWGTGNVYSAYKDYVGFKSARKFNVPTAGYYGFILNSDDGSEVYIDSDTAPVVTTNRPTSPQVGTKYLAAGDHIVKVNYREATGEAYLKFSMQYPSCTDSDGGKIYDVFGQVRSISTGGGGVVYSYADICLSDKKLQETYCDSGQKASVNVDCPGLCRYGKCIAATVTPTPTSTPTPTQSTVVPAPTVTLKADPPSITVGQATTLSWTSTNATSLVLVDIASGLQTSGSLTQYPTANTTYTINATGAGGTATAQATVTVVSAPGGTPVAGNQTISLKKGYNYFNIPESWGRVIQGGSATGGVANASSGITIFAYNWLGDELWQPSNGKLVTTLYPGVGYYAYTPAATTLSLGNGSAVTEAQPYPTIKRGWNLLANVSTDPIDLASTQVRVIKKGQTSNACNSVPETCSELKTIGELVNADPPRAYKYIFLISDPYSSDAKTAFTSIDARATGAKIPGSTSSDPAHYQGYWIYLWE